MKKNKTKYTLIQSAFLLLLFQIIAVNKGFATIPQAAKDDPRYALGYLVVTHYPGVNPDGTGDSRPGIQEAINDAYDNGFVVFFPSGTYQVSDVLKCYYWSFWDSSKNKAKNPPGKAHVLLGSSLGTNRPVIKLAGNAVGFDDPSSPRPVIAWHYYSATNASGTSKEEPPNPLTGAPANFMDQPNVAFGWLFRNIDIDLNNHSGAVGGVFAAAQCSGIADIRINATGAYCGIYGVPGRNSFITNIEVEGGKYGIKNNGDAAGSVLVNARLYNQTEYAITSEDFCPYSIVGFDIKTSAPQAIFIEEQSWWSTANGTLTLVDGRIEMLNQGTAINNKDGRNIYIENVYARGADNILTSGSQPALKGNSGWTKIEEYVFNNQIAASGTNKMASWSVINGVKSQKPEPVTKIVNSPPPTNLLDRHSWDKLPAYEGENDETVNPRSAPYNAKGDGVTDDWKAIQDAINNSTTGKVFLPKGDYVISKPLLLKSNTQLIGADQNYSILTITSKWSAGSKAFMIETADDAKASTFFGFIGFNDQATASTNCSGGFVHWQAGENSMIISTRHGKIWGSYYGTEVRYNYKFSSNGGGRHFLNLRDEEASDNVNSRQVYIEGTKRPLTFYGLNSECTKSRSTNPNIDLLGSNVEIVNSSNIRIHNMKREGHSPSVIIRDSKNIAVYGMGRLNTELSVQSGGYNQILGNSSNIVFALVVLDKSSNESFPILREELTGQSPVKIDWPNNVSIYKRGELTDIYSEDSNTSSQLIPVISNELEMTCFPNPAIEQLNIHFTLPESGRVNITVFNMQGQMVKIICDQDYEKGTNQLIWDRRSNRGRPVNSGVYYIRLEAGEISKTFKIVVL